jgi:hypothetical protein
MVQVYQADGIGGAPGTLLWSSDTVTGSLGNWNYVPIGTPISGYDFYIFYVQVDTYPNCPGMSTDGKREAPDNTQWDDNQGSFVPSSENPPADWLIRAIYNWTPQNHNLAALYFNNLYVDTLPKINLSVQATFKNMGLDTAPHGIPVKLHITGPLGYTKDYLTDTLVRSLAYRGVGTVTFTPTWHVPDTPGVYVVKAWCDWPAEEYRANDTMTWTMSAAQWYTYANWQTPEVEIASYPYMRATLFHPPDYNIKYPVEVSRVRHYFWIYPGHYWTDSLFQFAIYDTLGDSLWESDTIRAVPQTNMEAQVSPPVIIHGGDFYVACVPQGSNAYPSSVSDTHALGHSFYGSPSGGWQVYNLGEWFMSIAANTAPTIGVNERPIVNNRASLSLTARPNPSANPVIAWAIPRAEPVLLTLYDAAGREVRTMTVNEKGLDLAGTVKLNTRGIANGIYLLRLSAGTARATAKLVLNQ